MDRYRVNRPRIVDETIDGEALIMDMVTGSYYGCDGPSAFAWLALAAGASVDEVGQALAARFPIDADTARDQAAGLVESLLGHELLVDREGQPPGALDEAVAAYDGTFDLDTALSIDAFTDLADLILLDPVHDVTEAGWPNKRE